MVEVTSLTPPPLATAPRSPFIGHAAGDRPNKNRQVGVRLSAGTLPTVLLLSTWVHGADGLVPVVQAALNISATPAATGGVQALEDGLLIRTGPEEFMLLAGAASYCVEGLRQTITADLGSVTDLSHARCIISIEGEKSRDMLSKLFALDLREPQVPVGQIRLTVHHHVPCMLHRLGLERFDMVVFSTYVFDQLGMLIDAALEYGVGLQHAGEWAVSTA